MTRAGRRNRKRSQQPRLRDNNDQKTARRTVRELRNRGRAGLRRTFSTLMGIPE